MDLFPNGRLKLARNLAQFHSLGPPKHPMSVRFVATAESLGAEEGDFLFAIPDDDGCVHFELVRQSESPQPRRHLSSYSRLGQIEKADAWLPTCAIAIGLPRDAQADEVEALLEVHGDREVLRLFTSARRTGTAEPS